MGTRETCQITIADSAAGPSDVRRNRTPPRGAIDPDEHAETKHLRNTFDAELRKTRGFADENDRDAYADRDTKTIPTSLRSIFLEAIRPPRLPSDVRRQHATGIRSGHMIRPVCV